MAKRIKLLHITSSLKVGGAEAVLCDLIRHLGSQEFEHQVIYFHDGPNSERLRALSVPLYNVGGVFFLYDPLFLLRLYRTVQRIQPDCIHSLLWAANVSGRLVARLCNVPIVNVFHNNVDQDGAMRSFFDRTTVRLADVLVAVSHGVEASMRVRDRWLAARPIHVIPNGIDVDTLQRNNARYAVTRQQLGLLPEHFIIGSVGRLHPVKNYGLLLETVAHLCVQYAQVRLVLVGSGPQEAWLCERARHLGIVDKVFFVIGQPAYAYYSLFDCFTLTSPKEGISIALLEAMSFGIPCVVTSVEQCHAVLTSGKNGVVVGPGNVSLLCDAFATLIENVSLRTKLGAQGKEHVHSDYTVDRMVDLYRGLFRAMGSSDRC